MTSQQSGPLTEDDRKERTRWAVQMLRRRIARCETDWQLRQFEAALTDRARRHPAVKRALAQRWAAIRGGPVVVDPPGDDVLDDPEGEGDG